MSWRTGNPMTVQQNTFSVRRLQAMEALFLAYQLLVFNAPPAVLGHNDIQWTNILVMPDEHIVLRDFDDAEFAQMNGQEYNII